MKITHGHKLFIRKLLIPVNTSAASKGLRRRRPGVTDGGAVVSDGGGAVSFLCG